jgi:hypothetical protein
MDGWRRVLCVICGGPGQRGSTGWVEGERGGWREGMMRGAGCDTQTTTSGDAGCQTGIHLAVMIVACLIGPTEQKGCLVLTSREKRKRTTRHLLRKLRLPKTFRKAMCSFIFGTSTQSLCLLGTLLLQRLGPHYSYSTYSSYWDHLLLPHAQKRQISFVYISTTLHHHHSHRHLLSPPPPLPPPC